MEVKAINEVDRGYQYLLHDIMSHGQPKETRAGKVKSLFGKHFKIDLKKGFPLLTTKKVFTKGILHELLWFLQRPCNSHGSSNIEYLVRNNVHIWDDDAFRWFKEWVTKEIAFEHKDYNFVIADGDDEVGNDVSFEWWMWNDAKKNGIHWLLTLTKEEFLMHVLERLEIRVDGGKIYRFGDLGPVYGKQWRKFDGKNKTVDQIENIIKTLKTNPNDRRLLCVAYNPSILGEVALPPCHVMMQFYTRKLSELERWEAYRKKHKNEPLNENGTNKYIDIYGEAINPWTTRKYKDELNKELDKERIPVYGLSCMWTQRSVDVCCGLPFNIASYAFLTYMIANIVNMEPDILIGSLGDCHIYENHFEGVEEQLKRKGNDLPTLTINRKVGTIDQFRFEDFVLENYNPDPPIKYPLNVG